MTAEKHEGVAPPLGIREITTFDRIAAACDRKRRPYHVDAWGVELMLVEFDGAGRARLAEQFAKLDSNVDATAKLDALLDIIIACTCERVPPHTPVFADDEATRAMLRTKNGDALEALAAACMDVCGFGETALEDAEGKSEPTPSSRPGTD